MPEMTSYPQGVFSFIDLVAHDMEAAKRWYGDLFGWDAAEQPTHGGPPYAMFVQNGKSVAGIGQMSEEMKAGGVPPMWNSYVSVDDAAAIEKKVVELGGKVTVPTMKVMDAGWLAFFEGPTGAHFAVWQAGEHCGAQLVNEPNSLSWNELATRDVAKAKDFYGKLFGWSFEEIPMGDFNYTMVKAGDRSNGGMMPMQGDQWEGVPPHWMIYIAVADTDATVEKVRSTGGKILMPPTDIPQGRFSAVQDPQGAAFTVIKLNKVN